MICEATDLWHSKSKQLTMSQSDFVPNLKKIPSRYCDFKKGFKVTVAFDNQILIRSSLSPYIQVYDKHNASGHKLSPAQRQRK